MTPQDQAKSFVTLRIPGSETKWRQQRFPTDYCELINRYAPRPPASLMRTIAATNHNVSKKNDCPGRGKAKIMLRMSSNHTLPHASSQEFLRVEENSKHVSVFALDEKLRRNPALAPKAYSFDSVFTESMTQKTICNSTLPDVIQAVLQGADGTVFCYGQSNLGKSQVLFGQDDATENIGVLPCAISWLYHCIEELNKQQDVTYSVGVSAFEVYGRSEKLKDLLSKYCKDPPVESLRIGEDPLMGSQLQNRCKVQANTTEKVGYLLDAALASRSCSGSRNTAEGRRHSHMTFSLHVHRNKLGDSKGSEVESRLHFIDFGSCERTLVKTPNSLALSLSSLGHVIMAIVNNSRNIPFKESRLTSVLRELLGNFNCRAVMLAHVSRDSSHYSDTLSTIQMASRIHRVIKKRHSPRHCSRKDNPLQTVRGNFKGNERLDSSSGFENTSGSELSCDTVVYVNKKGQPMSERELTDNEGPPNIVTFGKKREIPVIVAATGSPERRTMVHSIVKIRTYLKECLSNEDSCDSKSQCKIIANSNKCESSSDNFSNARQTHVNRKIQPQHSAHANFVKNNFSSFSSDRRGLHPETVQPLDLKSSSIGLASQESTKLIAEAKLSEQNLTKFCDVQNPETDSGKPIKPQRSKHPYDNAISLSKNKKIAMESDCRKNDVCQKQHENYIISGVHQGTKDEKVQEHVNYVSTSASYSSRIAAENYPTDVDERPEPVGCAFDSENNSFLPNDQSDLYNSHDALFVSEGLQKPEKNGENKSNDDAVDVNLYCLTFATKSPLIPLSLSKLSHQFKSSFKKKSTETKNTIEREKATECSVPSHKNDIATNKSTNAGEHFAPKRDPFKYSSNLKLSTKYSQRDKVKSCDVFGKQRKVKEKFQWRRQNPKHLEKENGNTMHRENDLSEEELDISNIIPMPRLHCSYADGGKDKPEAFVRRVSRNHRSNHSSFRRNCVYDTNSSDFNYADAIHSQSLHLNTTSGKSPHFTETSERKETKSDFSTNTPVVPTMSKSSAEDGAILSIVKKQNSNGPTLELLITNENDKRSKNRPVSKSTHRFTKLNIIKKFCPGKKKKVFPQKNSPNLKEAR